MIGREGGVAIGTPHLAVGVLVSVAVVAYVQVSTRAKYGAIAMVTRIQRSSNLENFHPLHGSSSFELLMKDFSNQ